MSQENSKRIKLVETEDFTIQLEYNELYAIVHLERCEKFNKRIFSEIKSYLDGLNDFVITTGYVGLYTASMEEKPEKLAHLLGFEYLGQQDGIKVFIYASNSSNRGS